MLQAYLVNQYGFQTVGWTAHQEKETLFWTKVASILGLPQDRMLRSVVPYSRKEAYDTLTTFLENNGIPSPPKQGKAADFQYTYFQLAERFGPCFVEKSPHHLFNRSNLELIVEAKRKRPQACHVILIGLIRNPMDTIYSAWKRWKYDPMAYEAEWRQSYHNLKALLKREPLLLFRYEDLVRSTDALDSQLQEHGLSPKGTSDFEFYGSSIRAWRKDPAFAHRLQKDTITLAEGFGYSKEDLLNPNSDWKWPLRKLYYRTRYRLAALVR